MFTSFSDAMAWRRTRAMAGQSGLDLAGAVVDGWLRRDELDRFVATCGDCGKDGVCAAASIPCPNAHVLKALRP